MSHRSDPRVCPRCGQPVDPLEDSYTFDGQPAHVICPPGAAA